MGPAAVVVVAAPGLAPDRPAATIRAWIGLGCQRGSWKLCSQNDLATSKLTSTPTRSISSNGPIRKPPPIRRSGRSGRAGRCRSPSSRSASSVNGRASGWRRSRSRRPRGSVRGPSPARPRWPPPASPRRSSSPATISTSRISAGGLKKCMPTPARGRSTPAAIAVTDSEEVLVASTASGPQTSASSANSCASARGPPAPPRSRARSRRAPRARSTRFSRPAPPRPRLRSSVPRSAPFARPSRTRGAHLRQRLAGRVVEAGLEPAQAGELGDAGAHRPGADDADPLDSSS